LRREAALRGRSDPLVTLLRRLDVALRARIEGYLHTVAGRVVEVERLRDATVGRRDIDATLARALVRL
jgi:hypothetical protein